MKKLTIIVILVAAIALIMPLAVGMQAQNKLEEGIADANAQAGTGLTISLEDYQRGWLKSQAKLRVRFADEAMMNNPAMQSDEFLQSPMGVMLSEGMVNDISVLHGPIVFNDNLQFGLGQITTVLDGHGHADFAALLEATGNPYFAKSTIDIGFNGLGDIKLDAPSFTYDDQDSASGKVIFAGASAAGQIDFSDMHIVLEAQMNGFSVVTSDSEMVIERTLLTTDMAYPEDAPYGIGGGELVMDRMVALNNNATAIDIQQVKLTFNTARTGTDKVAMAMAYNIGGFTTAGTQVDDLIIDISLRDVHAPALIALQEAGSTLNAEANDPQAMLQSFAAPTYDLLAGGLVLEVAPLQFQYNKQPMLANIVVTTHTDALPPKASFSFDNPMLFMGLFKVNADLSIDRNLAIYLAIPQVKQQLLAGVPEGSQVDEAQLNAMAEAQAPMMIGALVGQGLLRENGPNYEVNASFDRGALLVNGNPLPLGAMLTD